MELTPRRRNIISGLCALVLVTAAFTIGVKYSFGAFEQGYTLTADFAAAGQGLVEGSDIKMRGVNIGEVRSIRLVDGAARVTLFIHDGNRIPLDTSSFEVRAKTLFGEKFIAVEPGAEEATGPYFADGGVIPRYFDDASLAPEGTLRDSEGRALRAAGGFELERVLADAYPILRAIDPDELANVVHSLAAAADGLGETVNRSLVDGEQVLDVLAAHDADTRRFLEDLAALSDELATRAPDVISGARDLNVALPVLNENADGFRALLEQSARVSGQVADLLEANTAFIDSVYSDGQEVLDTLYGQRDQLIPLVVGIREYTRNIALVSRIPVGDGTVMAAVKGLLGTQTCIIIECTGGPGPNATAAGPALTPEQTDAVLGLLGDVDGHVSEGTQAVLDLLRGLLGTG